MAFLKPTTSRADEPAPPVETSTPPAAHSNQPSLISNGAEFAGSIVAPGELQVHGTIKGDVRGATVTICAGGKVEGDVYAENIHVHGMLRGRLFGKNVRIGAGADVVGDIRHCTLGLDPEAEFEGSVKRVENPLAEAATA